MTQIATLEELEALAVGTSVQIGRETWGRSEQGLTLYGGEVPFAYFTNPIQQGQVTVVGSGGRERGQVCAWRGHRWVLLSQVGTSWNAVRTSPGADAWFQYVQQVAVADDWTPVTDYSEEWKQSMLAAGDAVLSAQAGASGGSSPGMDPGEVESALHTYLENHGGLTSTEREDLEEVLDELGLDRPARPQVDVDVTIEVEGTWSTYMDSEMAEKVGGGVSVDTDQVEIPWTYTINTSFEVEEGTCACGMVDQDWVREHLNNEGVTYQALDEGTWSFTESCDND